jgi:flagellar assembly protein FliH
VQEAEEHHARHLAALQTQHQAAREEAYRNGYNDGAAMARDSAAAELDRAARFVETLHAELVRTRREWFEAYERQMVELVCRALEQILGDRPSAAEPVGRALAAAFARLEETDRVTVRCHPQDLKLIREHRDSQANSPAGSLQIKWVADEDIRPGGCLVETSLGVVDARVEQQLAILRGVLWDALPQAGTDADPLSQERGPAADHYKISVAASPST